MSLSKTERGTDKSQYFGGYQNHPTPRGGYGHPRKREENYRRRRSPNSGEDEKNVDFHDDKYGNGDGSWSKRDSFDER